MNLIDIQSDILKIFRKLLPIFSSILLFAIMWLFFDLALGNKIAGKIDESKTVTQSRDLGWYELKPNYDKFEYFGNKRYRVTTNSSGFRSLDGANTRSKVLFLGDSFVHGVGVDNENTIPGLFEAISGSSTLNGGVSSYSPTAYLHRYRKALADNLLEEKHKVFVGIDISDVQDEAAIWVDGEMHPERRKSGLAGAGYLTRKIKESFETNDYFSGIKSFLRQKLPLTWRTYALFRQIIDSPKPELSLTSESLRNNQPPKSVLTLLRSAFTWTDWNDLDAEVSGGYSPLGVKGGLNRVQEKIQELVKDVHKSRGTIYLYTYPWPAQIEYQSKERFNFANFISRLCQQTNCDGYIPVYEDFLEQSVLNKEWYSKFYIPGDVHFNEKGNQLVAQSIFSFIKGIE